MKMEDKKKHPWKCSECGKINYASSASIWADKKCSSCGHAPRGASCPNCREWVNQNSFYKECDNCGALFDEDHSAVLNWEEVEKRRLNALNPEPKPSTDWLTLILDEKDKQLEKGRKPVLLIMTQKVGRELASFLAEAGVGREFVHKTVFENIPIIIKNEVRDFVLIDDSDWVWRRTQQR